MTPELIHNYDEAIPRSLTYTVLCSRNPVNSSCRSLLLGTKAPSLPFVIRSRCSVVPAFKAKALYSSLADPPLGILISFGSFLTGFPGLNVNPKDYLDGAHQITPRSNSKGQLISCHCL